MKKYFCRSSKWTSDADVFKLNDEKWLQNYSEALKFSKWRTVFKKIQVSGNLVCVGRWKFSKCQFDKKNFKSSDEKLSKCWPKEVLKILPSWDFSQNQFLVNLKISEKTRWLKVASKIISWIWWRLSSQCSFHDERKFF